MEDGKGKGYVFRTGDFGEALVSSMLLVVLEVPFLICTFI